MTIAACDAGLIHLALAKGTIHIDFIRDLPIVMIHPGVERSGQVMVHQPLSVGVIFADWTATRMTTRACLDFLIRHF